MTKLIHTLLLCLVGVPIAYTQNYIEYYKLVNEAEYWMYKEHPKNALILYEKAFKEYEPFGKDLFLAAKCQAMLKNKKQCWRYLKQSALKVTTYPSAFIYRDSTLFENALGKLKPLKIQLKAIETERQLRQSPLINMLRDTAGAMAKTDQLYRQQGIRKEEAFLRQLHANDSLNQLHLLNIIQQCGYPGYNVIGNDALSIVLMHIIDAFKPMYLQITQTELQTGHLLPYEYAEFIDKHAYKQNKDTCIYMVHEFVVPNCKPNDFKRIIKNRYDIGLSIFFMGNRKRPFDPFIIPPWRTRGETLVEQYLTLKP